MDSGISVRAARVRGNLPPQEHQLTKWIADVTQRAADNYPNQQKYPTWNVRHRACQWEGILCNESEQVTEIKWSHRGISGFLKWEFLPHTLVKLNLMSNNLGGVIPIERLPSSLEVLDLSFNNFHRGIDLSLLSAAMNTLTLSHNQFSGEALLTCLPQNMDSVYLSRNAFIGTPDLTCLPPMLRYLSLANNAFFGYVRLDALPSKLIALDLSGNPEVHVQDDKFQIIDCNVVPLAKKYFS